MPFKELNCSSCTFTDMLQFICFDILSILFSSALIKRICSFQASFSYCKANNILCFLCFFPHFSFHDWDFLFTYYRPSSFDLKLPLSVLSCTTPDSKNFDINFNDGGSKSQVLFVSSVSCLWVVECICLSLILFVNWLFKDLECKRWYHSLQL